jgi:cytokinin riboside 5'-monophosphate phosphoribohydrolase
MVVGVLYHY